MTGRSLRRPNAQGVTKQSRRARLYSVPQPGLALIVGGEVLLRAISDQG